MKSPRQRAKAVMSQLYNGEVPTEDAWYLMGVELIEQAIIDAIKEEKEQL